MRISIAENDRAIGREPESFLILDSILQAHDVNVTWKRTRARARARSAGMQIPIVKIARRYTRVRSSRAMVEFSSHKLGGILRYLARGSFIGR